MLGTGRWRFHRRVELEVTQEATEVMTKVGMKIRTTTVKVKPMRESVNFMSKVCAPREDGRTKKYRMAAMMTPSQMDEVWVTMVRSWWTARKVVQNWEDSLGRREGELAGGGVVERVRWLYKGVEVYSC